MSRLCHPPLALCRRTSRSSQRQPSGTRRVVFRLKNSSKATPPMVFRRCKIHRCISRPPLILPEPVFHLRPCHQRSSLIPHNECRPHPPCRQRSQCDRAISIRWPLSQRPSLVHRLHVPLPCRGLCCYCWVWSLCCSS